MPGIKEQVGIEVFMNDQPIPAGQSTYGTIQVVETIKYTVPFLRIDVDDTTFELANERQITEGTKVKARFYRFTEEKRVPFSRFIMMRKPNGQRSPEGTTPQYWYAFLDIPQFQARQQPQKLALQHLLKVHFDGYKVSWQPVKYNNLYHEHPSTVHHRIPEVQGGYHMADMI